MIEKNKQSQPFEMEELTLDEEKSVNGGFLLAFLLLNNPHPVPPGPKF